jgi:antitoxin component YwqK of YwqJK toxin-antitoxin module
MKQYIKILTLTLGTILFGNDIKACECSDPFLRIDSLPQLKEYDFIAYVKITEDQDYKKPSGNDYETIGLLRIKIIELFKGTAIKQVMEYSKNSSCDIGVSKGEEWILFGKTIDGKIGIVSCDRNERYKETNELRDWKYDDGFYELSQLRKLYQHPITKYENDKHLELYSNGQKEIEEIYLNGKLNGERKIWYPNGILFCKQTYISDTLDGKSVWYYESGQVYEEDFYLKGQPCNVSRIYYDFSDETSEPNRKKIQVQYETVFDSYGWAIISREYSSLGKILKEETIDHERKFRVVIYYHHNGAISSIMYSLNGKNYGHYQTYDEKGFPARSWDYDENGEVIKSTMK